jgi:4'-phosphopantetheinyl transferase EntD
MLVIGDLRRLISASVGLGFAQNESRAQAFGGVDSLRAAEFARGREAAFAALASIGVAAEGIPAGPNGAPVWPTGVVGSITHTANIALAVAARTSDRIGIGIDVEREDRRLDPRTIRRIFTESELRRLSTASGHESHQLALFCAKEATYKALDRFVPTLRWHDVDFRPDGTGHLTGALSARAAGFAPVEGVDARVLVSGGFVVVCVEIPVSNEVSRANPVPSARAGTVPGVRGSR